MNKADKKSINTSDASSRSDLHEACIVDENGNEVAITEDMIEDAINKIEKDLSKT